MIRQGSGLLHHARGTAGVVGPMGFEHYCAMYERSVQAAALLEQERRCYHRPRRLRDFAAATLARATGPLPLESVNASALAFGYRARGTTSGRYLRSVLRGHPQLFLETSPGSWCIAASRQRGNPPTTLND